MAKRLYVGNLPYSVTEDDIRTMFEEYGAVDAVDLISDRETGQSRGFGFVEMADDDASEAIAALNGTDYGGRSLRVNEARPKRERDFGGGGGGGGYKQRSRW